MKHAKQGFGIFFISFALLVVSPVWSFPQTGKQNQKDLALIQAIQDGDDQVALDALAAGANGEAMGTFIYPPSNLLSQLQDEVSQLQDEKRAYQEVHLRSKVLQDIIQDLDRQIQEETRRISKIRRQERLPALLLLRKQMWQRFRRKGPDMDLVRAVVNHGAKVDDRDTDGRTPLFYASSLSSEITRLLISRGAAINVSDKDGVTPLMQADVEETKILLEYGAKINAVDELHQTALLRAADNRQIDKVRVLLEHGASVAMKDQYHSTALDYVTATDPVGEQIYALLKQHGAK